MLSYQFSYSDTLLLSIKRSLFLLAVFAGGCSRSPVFPPELLVDPTELLIQATGGDTSIRINSNMRWTITLPDWIETANPGGAGAASVPLTIHANPQTTPRTGTLLIQTVDASKQAVVTVTQQAGSNQVTWEKQFATNGACFGLAPAEEGFFMAEQLYYLESGGIDMTVRKFHADGSEAWHKTMPYHYLPQTGTLAAAPDGVVLLLRVIPESRLKVIKLDNAGNIKWETEILQLDPDLGCTINPKPGGYWITGSNGHQLLLLPVTENGVLQDPITQPGFGNFFINGAATDPAGALAITGRYGDDHAFVWMLSNSGTLRWHRDYGDEQKTIGQAVTFTTSGNLTVVGQTNPTPINSDLWVTELNASGTLLWQKTYGGPTDEYCTSVLPVADGLLIGGGQYLLPDYEGWLIRLHHDGSKQQEQRITGQTEWGAALTFLAPAPGGFFIAGTNGAHIWYKKLALE